jgi:hypothetical protein
MFPLVLVENKLKSISNQVRYSPEYFLHTPHALARKEYNIVMSRKKERNYKHNR